MEHSQSYQITHSYATRYNSTHSALTSVAEIIFQRVSIASYAKRCINHDRFCLTVRPTVW